MCREGQLIFGKKVLEYVIVEEFLADLKKEFGGEDDETMKIAEL